MPFEPSRLGVRSAGIDLSRGEDANDGGEIGRAAALPSLAR